MSKAKKILATVFTSMAVGAVIGMLFAPDKGYETRKKIRRLKNGFGCYHEEDEIESYDHQTLEALSQTLQKRLDKINEQL